MNIIILVVGQKTRLQSGNQFREATVREVTEYHTDVEPIEADPFLGDARYFIRLNNRTGKQAGTFVYIGDAFGWGEQDRRPLCGDEGRGEPWELAEC